MTNRSIRWLVVVSALAVTGLLSVQSYWVYQTLKIKQSEFRQSVTIALRRAAVSMSKYNRTKLPTKNLIQRPSTNYYVVNINSPIDDPSILEYFLIKEFERVGISEPFEYGIYDCASDDLAYGNCCNYDDEIIAPSKRRKKPKSKDLIYYFVVRFPGISSFFLREMWFSVLFSGIIILVSLFLAYALYVILQQKRYSEVQRDFINNLTHEFKTPITSISLAAQTLQESQIVQKDTRLKRYTDLIVSQNKRLNAQVEKVLEMARLPQNMSRVTLKQVSLHDLIEQIIPEMKVRIEAEKGRLLVNLFSKYPIIEADELHVSNILHTLLDNAIKYKKDYPVISILTVDVEDGCKLVIEDKGIGIDKKHLKHLFKRFYRVPTGKLHNVKGFGLGLYYVDQVVRAHHWTLDVTSTKGEGTRFSIRFHNNK